MVSVLEALTGRVVLHLPLAVRPEYFCFKADGGQLFVTGQGMDAVVVIYPYSTEVAATLLAGRAPGAMAVSTSPDQEYLFVANPQSGDVTILDIELHRVIAVASVGQDPGFITMTPDNQYALVLNRRSGNMAVIRIAAIVPSRARSAPLFTMIPVGSRPVSAAVQVAG
jgi:YVTN family beta-propeller protein